MQPTPAAGLSAADQQGQVEREVLRTRGALERQTARALREAAALNRYVARQERSYTAYLRAEYGALKRTAPAPSLPVPEPIVAASRSPRRGAELSAAPAALRSSV